MNMPDMVVRWWGTTLTFASRFAFKQAHPHDLRLRNLSVEVVHRRQQRVVKWQEAVDGQAL